MKLWLSMGAVVALVLLGGLALLGLGAPDQVQVPAETTLQDPASHQARAFFEPKAPPQAGDWLATVPEKPQSLAEYIASEPTGRTARRRRIVLQPLGPFDARQRQVLELMRELSSIFFNLPTTIAPPLGLPERGKRMREAEGRRWPQYHTTRILHDVLAPNLPQDAICYLGITTEDLYPEPSWSYVFGQASLKHRVGVWSLARYFPEFHGQEPTEDAWLLGLRRSIAVLAHETGHLFSIPHCVRYECLMNGSNSLEESDRQPQYLCPDCLQKLHWNLGFDVADRYVRLRDFYRRVGLTDLADWVHRRLRHAAEVGAFY